MKGERGEGTMTVRQAAERGELQPGIWRVRLIYMAVTLLIMAAGLASRRFSALLPDWLASHLGDALWAAMVYYGIRCLLPRHRPVSCLMLALCFSYAIEFSQLYQAEWILALRRTTLGALVLGHGFLLADLVRYAVGILCAYAADVIARRLNEG